MNLEELLQIELLGNTILAWAASFGVFLLVLAVLGVVRRVVRKRLLGSVGDGSPPALQIARHVTSRTAGWFLVLVALYVGSRLLAPSVWTDTNIPRVVVIGLVIQLGLWATAGLAMFLTLRRARQLAADPSTVAAMGIIQNGDIYEDALGPKYAGLKAYFAAPSAEKRHALESAVSEHGFRDEFLNQVSAEVAERISPDLWQLNWALLQTARRREIMVGLMEGLKENLAWFPRYQAYLREHQPATLIVWGPQDGYMPEASARAYLRDLPDAELHLLPDAGHWALETHLDAVVERIRAFLARLPEGR